MNKSILIGRLGADAEVRYMPDGSPVSNMRIATDESYKNQIGEKVERTEWHRIVAFNKLAEIAQAYATKGRLVCVEGKLRTRKWTDEHKIDRYVTEIVASTVRFLDNKKKDDAQPAMSDDAAPVNPMDNVPF